jgi:hypothetical protein
MDQPRPFIGRLAGKAGRFESAATFVAVARYDAPPTKGGSRGQWHHRWWIDKPLQTGTIGICGAMSLQGGDSGRGNESVPQKLVHLVGCRDPKVRPEPWGRPQPVPAKP